MHQDFHSVICKSINLPFKKKASLVEKHKIQQYFFKQNNNDSKRVILFYNGQDRKERFLMLLISF